MRSRPLAAALLTLAGLALGPASAAHAADPVPVTPAAPVVVDDACGVGQDTLTFPQTDGASFSFDVDGARVVVPEGVALPGMLTLFAGADGEVVVDGDDWPDEISVSFDVTADEGHVLADGAPTTVPVVLDTTACAAVENPPVVVTSGECEQVSITNPKGNPRALVALSQEESWEVVDTTLAPGATTTLEVAEGRWSWWGTDTAGVLGWTAYAQDQPRDATPARRAAAALAADPSLRAADLPRLLGGRARAEAAAGGDWELTSDDIDFMRAFGVLVDGLVSGPYDLGAGAPGPAVTPVDDPTAPVPDDGPEVPALVQTDGGGSGYAPGGMVILLGGLVLGAGAVVRRSLRA